MQRRLFPRAAVVGLLLVARPVAAMDDIAAKERVGLRFGYIGTSDGLRDKYGDGWDATLYFTEAVSTHFLVDIRLGAIYLGTLHDPQLDDAILNQPGINTSMRIIYFSVGPLASVSLGGPYTLYATLGGGVYSVSMTFDSGVTGFDFSDQHLGANGGLGLSWRFAGSWCLELNTTAHYFDVGNNNNDLYWVFTAGADNPLLIGVSAGVTLDLR